MEIRPPASVSDKREDCQVMVVAWGHCVDITAFAEIKVLVVSFLLFLKMNEQERLK